MILSRSKRFWFLISLAGACWAALPNLFPEDPAIRLTLPEDVLDQMFTPGHADFPPALAQGLKKVTFDESKATPSDKSETLELRYTGVEDQFAAFHYLEKNFKTLHPTLLLLPGTPDWLRPWVAAPMKLGLDLRGGVSLLMEVRSDLVVQRQIEGWMSSLKRYLQDKSVYYQDLELLTSTSVVQRLLPMQAARWGFLVKLQEPPTAKTLTQMRKDWVDFDVVWGPLREEMDHAAEPAGTALTFVLKPASRKRWVEQALEQTLLTLRRRVNELGVAEAIVQRQSDHRVVVELPGVQDMERAKRILGKTAALELRLLASPQAYEDYREKKRVPPGTLLVPDRKGRPVLLNQSIALTGESVVHATVGHDRDDGAAVNIRLNAEGGRRFFELTSRNVGKPLAVLYSETEQQHVKTEVVSVATIRSPLSEQFQITGLNMEEARDLALLLRAGALPAPLLLLEERIVGPSLGQENIKAGCYAGLLGLALVFAFMMLYYRLMGLFANLALLMNAVFLMALLSLLGATLTLSGIAGFILTLGMAVDANVLIFERIREEWRLGQSIRLAIQRGFDEAWATILDANITTLIAGLVLFLVGSGAVKGFALTLCLGILTSLYSSVLGSKILVYWFYGRNKHLERISIGI